MAVYCGVDIIEIERIKTSILEVNGFRERVFTEEETIYCENRKNARFESYAARFAAKEAVVKALGTGMAEGLGWKHIEILTNDKGKPYAVLHQKAGELYTGMKAKSLDISISHCGAYAIAYAVIEA
jgi:holo-[acyl-carrier protein] synthase